MSGVTVWLAVRESVGRQRLLVVTAAVPLVLALVPGATDAADAADAAARSDTTVLPFAGLNNPRGVAVDRAGNVFVADQSNHRVVELPAGATSSSQQFTLPFSGLGLTTGIAVDRAGDVFVVDYVNNRAVMLPAGATSSSQQVVLPFAGSSGPNGVAVDRHGNVFVADNLNGRVVELPAGATSSSQQVTLPFASTLNPVGVAVDSVGDVIVTNNNGVGTGVYELPVGATAQVQLPFTAVQNPFAVAVDSFDDVYLAAIDTGQVTALPARATTSHDEVTLPFAGLGLALAVTVDRAGNVYAIDGATDSVLELAGFVSAPSIRAHVSSAAQVSSAGWYRRPVTVSFTCRVHGFGFTKPCPAPVTLTHNGAGQSVARTVRTVNGLSATARVAHLNIDQNAPRLRVTGVRNGAIYRGTARRPRCEASDGVSGVASCRVTTHIVGSRVVYRARAVDKAGNTATRRGHYTSLPIYLAHTPYTNGAFDVRADHHYTLVVTGTSRRPVYYDAAMYTTQPTQRDKALRRVGPHQWQISLWMHPGMDRHRLWNLGVHIGHITHTIKVRVT